MNDPSVDDAFAAVCCEYDKFETEDPEGKQELAAIKEYIRSRYSETNRFVTNAARAYCKKQAWYGIQMTPSDRIRQLLHTTSMLDWCFEGWKSNRFPKRNDLMRQRQVAIHWHGRISSTLC